MLDILFALFVLFSGLCALYMFMLYTSKVFERVFVWLFGFSLPRLRQ